MFFTVLSLVSRFILILLSQSWLRLLVHRFLSCFLITIRYALNIIIIIQINRRISLLKTEIIHMRFIVIVIVQFIIAIKSKIYYTYIKIITFLRCPCSINFKHMELEGILYQMKQTYLRSNQLWKQGAWIYLFKLQVRRMYFHCLKQIFCRSFLLNPAGMRPLQS